MWKKTKIIATIGPSSDSIDVMKKMIKNGVNVFRFNFSHGSHEYHLENLNKVRKAAEEMNEIIGTLQDISGPKVRVGILEDDFKLRENDIIKFKKKNIKINGEYIKGKCINPENNTQSPLIFETYINYPELLNKISTNERIYLADGSIELLVTDKNDKFITCTVKNDGILKSNKGVNFPDTKIDIDIITDKDKKDIEFGLENKFTFMGLSFVQSANDIIKTKTLIESIKLKNNIEHDVFIISKIEKFDAVDNINEILEETDGIMVARGDLGIEVPFYTVPNIQKEIIEKCNNLGKPVIVATQVLLSMTDNKNATRAEISDVANAVMDGTDGIMLSEETAVGIDPVNVIKTMSKTIVETEKKYRYYRKMEVDTQVEAMTFSTIQLAKHLNLEKIFSFTMSGTSVRKISKFKPKTPIYAIPHKLKTAEELTLTWGVYIPYLYLMDNTETGDMIINLINDGVKDGLIETNSNKEYVVVAGYPAQIKGNINFIRVLRQEDINFFLDKKMITYKEKTKEEGIKELIDKINRSARKLNGSMMKS